MYGYAYYSCLKPATIIRSNPVQEVQFTVPSGSSYEDEYTIYWNGSCVLQHLYVPDNTDILQLVKEFVYSDFTWGFVCVSFNPTGLARYRYGLGEEGLWRFEMVITDPTVPSLFFAPDGFSVSIHRLEWTRTSQYLEVGEKFTIDVPSVPDWHTGKVDYFHVYANSSQVDVEGALLEYSYHYTSGTDVYDWSRWRPYNNTIVITNIWMEPLLTEVYSRAYTFKDLAHEATEDSLEFTLDSSAFDSTQSSRYSRLEILSKSSLNSSALHVPKGARAEDLNRILADEHYTMAVTYRAHNVSLNPYYAWKVLEDDVYGIWHLDLNSTYSIAITDVKLEKTVVGLGLETEIQAEVANQGGFTETLNIAAYANTTIIDTPKAIILASENSTTVTFTWNTTGFAKGNYSISAYATPIPGETYTKDNNFTGGWIIVAMVGDITGPEGWPDGKCDIRDVAMVAKLFGVNYPDTDYDPNCDIVYDFKIDIKDVATVAKHYGEIDP